MIDAFFDIIFASVDFIEYILSVLVPFGLVMFAIGIIWGLCKYVFYH